MLPIKLKLVWGGFLLLLQHKSEEKKHTHTHQPQLDSCLALGPQPSFCEFVSPWPFALGEFSMDMHKGQFPYGPPSHYIHPSTKRISDECLYVIPSFDFPFVHNMFLLCSQRVPSRFPQCSPRVFPIAAHFNPICFAQSPPLLTYRGGPKGESFHLSIETSVLGSLHINFSCCHVLVKMQEQ